MSMRNAIGGGGSSPLMTCCNTSTPDIPARRSYKGVGSCQENVRCRSTDTIIHRLHRLHRSKIQMPIARTVLSVFICEAGVLVEVKAAASLSTQDEGQLLNYLKASKIRRGLLINFGTPTLQYKRRVWGHE